MEFKLLRRATNRAYKQELSENEIAIISSVVRETTGSGSLYGSSDSFTTEVDLGTGSAITDVFIGRSGQEVTLQGGFQAVGDLNIRSDNIILNKDVVSAVNAAFATERGSTNLDAMLLWNEVSNRVEIGLGETTGGTATPASLSTFTNLKINDLLLAGTEVTADSELTITATGTASDLTLIGRSSSIIFNDASNTVLSGYTATSIFGAFNELQSSATSAIVANNYTNEDGSTINQGHLVYLSGTDSVTRAIATTNNAASLFLGVVQDASILDTASGTIVSKGIYSMRFEASLSLSAGDEVFMSISTVGSATNIRPTSGVIQSLGFVKNPSSYDGTTNLNAIVHISRGARTVL